MASLDMCFEPGDIDAARDTIDELTDRFEDWYRLQHPEVDADFDLGMLLDWKVNYGDGRLDVWSVADVEDFVLMWVPRKISAPASWARPMVDSVAEGIRFLGDQGLLSPGSDPADRLAQFARSLAAECERRMADPSNFGMAKSLFSSMGVDFEDELTPEDLQSVMEQFNSLPFEQRKAFTEPFMGAGVQERLSMGPVLMPTEEQVLQAAAAAPVLTGFKALCDYFEAPGRALTAAGNIKLADAGALSEILGTESVAESHAGHTIRRRSSADMPELDHWQWWAREAGALRVNKSRLIGVSAWRKRVERDPVAEASKAFEILDDFGAVSSFRQYTMFDGDDLIDQAIIPLLAMPLRAQRSVEFTEMLDALQRIREQAGIGARFRIPEMNRDSAGRDLDLMLRMAERAGVVVQHGVAHEKSRGLQRRTGGTVSLTAFGIATVVEYSRRAGIVVQTIDPPEAMSASDLAGVLAQHSDEIDLRWDLLSRWLAVQRDRRRSLAELFDSLQVEDLPSLIFAETPDELVDDFAAVLRQAFETRRPDEPVAVAAFGWLIQHGQLDPAELDPEIVQLSRLAMFGFVAEADPESVGEQWGVGQSRAEQLAEIEAIARLMPTNSVALLEAIGRHYPDKVVAKSARREALKVRSRLANQRKG